MTTLITFLTIVDIFVALLIIISVLVQQSNSGSGLGTTFGGGGSDSLFGAHANFQLTKATICLTIVFFIITLSLTIITAYNLKLKNKTGVYSILNSISMEQSTTDKSQEACIVDEN